MAPDGPGCWLKRWPRWWEKGAARWVQAGSDKWVTSVGHLSSHPYLPEDRLLAALPNPEVVSKGYLVLYVVGSG